MHSSIRRGLSALAAAALIVGSALVASPASATVGEGFDSPLSGELTRGDVHVVGTLGAAQSGVAYKVDSGSNVFLSGTFPSTFAPFDFTLVGLGNGPHWVYVFSPGEGPGITQTFTIDNDAPVITDAFSPSSGWVSPNSDLNYHATISDASEYSYTVSVETTSPYYAFIQWRSGASTGPDPQPADLDFNFAADTSNTLYIQAIDAVGNTTTLTHHFGADSAVPSVTITSPSNGAVVSGALDLLFAGTDSASGVVSVDLDAYGVKPDGVTCKTASLRDYDPVLTSGDQNNGEYTTSVDTTTGPDGKFCLTAVVVDALGHSASSTIIVTVDNTAPTVPTAITTGWVENPSIFDWTNSTDAHGPVTYEARYGDDPDLANNYTAWATGLTQSKLVIGGDLHPGAWRWQVRAKDAVGNYSAWSAVEIIYVIGKPVITEPTCGCSYIAGDSIDVAWQGVDAPGNVHHYVVKFTNGGDSFTRNVVAPDLGSNPDTTWSGQIPASAPDGDWTIRVRAIYNDEFEGSTDGLWSDPVTVHYDGHGPTAPELVAPIDGFQTNDDHVTLEWEAPEPDVAQYILHWNKTGNIAATGLLSGANFAPIGDDTNYEFASLNDGTYYWQLAAIDDAGNLGDWSDVWHGTVDTVAPDQVSLLSLLDHTTTTSKNFTFTWSPIPDADSYEIEVSPTSDLALDGSLVDGGSQYPTSASKSVTNVPNGTYYWHVRAFDAVGNSGEWSELWTVKVAVPAPVVGGHSIADTGTGDDADDPEPSATPTPEPSETSEPAPSESPSAEASDSPAPVAASDSDDSGFPVGWIIVIVVVALVGGGLLIRFLIVRAP